MSRWWAIAVHGVKQWQCFDACPVHACLPYVARRIAAITPKAKIVVMVRDPVEGLFSAEIMLRDLGVPLDWTSLSEPGQDGCDMRFQAPSKSDDELWNNLFNLGPDVSGAQSGLAAVSCQRSSLKSMHETSPTCATTKAPNINLKCLNAQDPLPDDMPASLYFSLSSLVRCGDYAKMLEPYFQHFPPEK
eukprot:1160370-Pelagomonas_calceolata.AAC.3